MMFHFSINKFFTSSTFGVIGASNDRNKFGNKVLCAYQAHQLTVYPVNPNETMIEGIPCIESIEKLPESVKSISIITPANITERLVKSAIEKGITNIWMQPGAESELAIQTCIDNHINIIAGGPCILVELQKDERSL